MNMFELIGYATCYIAAVIALAYAGVIALSLIFRNKGLEFLGILVMWFYGVIGIGAVTGLILLGRML